MIKQVTFSFRRLRAARHVAYHTTVLTNIMGHGTTALGLGADDVAAYKAAIAREQDYVNTMSGSDYTPVMQESDTRRKAIAQDILYRLTYSRYSGNAEVAAQYEAVKYAILGRYKRLSSVDYSSRTGLVNGLLLDLAKLPEAVLSELGIGTSETAGLRKELRAAQTRFETAFLGRTAQRAQCDITLSEAREAVDDLYEPIAAQIFGIANLSPAFVSKLGEDGADIVQANETTARELNELAGYYIQQYLTTATATDGEDGEGSGAGDDDADGSGSGSGSGSSSGSGSGAGSGSSSGSGSGSGSGSSPSGVVEVDPETGEPVTAQSRTVTTVTTTTNTETTKE